MCKYVLILVVVEDVLVLGLEKMVKADLGSLNPCCGGRYSSTYVRFIVTFEYTKS